MNYTNFKGLKMCKPQQGSGYDITVEPGKQKTVLIWCHPEGYAMSSSSSTQIVQGGKKLKEMCRETGKKAARPDPDTGEEFDIC